MKMYDPREERVLATRGSMALSLQAILTSILGLAFFVLLARILGPFELGVYAAVSLVTALGSILGGHGLQQAAVRYAAYLKLRGQEPQARRTVFLLAIGASAVAGAVLYAVAPWAAEVLVDDASAAGPFRFTAVLVPMMIVAIVLDGWTQGMQAYGRLAAARVLSRGLSVGLGAILLLAGWGVLGALWSLAAYYAFLAAALAPHFVRGLLGRGWFSSKAILSFSGPITASGVATFGANYTESLLVIAFLTTADLGVYNVALTVGTVVLLLIVGPFLAAVLPTSSRVASVGRNQAGVFAGASRYLTLLVLPGSVGLAVLSPQWVQLLAGPAFVDAAFPAAILAIASLPFAISGMLSTLLLAEGRAGRVLLATVLPIPVAVGVGFLLVPFVGLTGAALTRVALYLGGLAAAWGLARDVIPVTYDWRVLGKAALASAALGVPVFLLQAWNASLFFLPAYVLLGAGICLLVLRATGTLNGEDRELAVRILTRRLAWVALLL